MTTDNANTDDAVTDDAVTNDAVTDDAKTDDVKTDDAKTDDADAGTTDEAFNGYPRFAPGSIRQGQIAILQGRPCRINGSYETHIGKHGESKYSFVGVDVFTEEQVRDARPAGATVCVVEITLNRYELCRIIELDDKLVLSLVDEVTREHKYEVKNEDMQRIGNLLEDHALMIGSKQQGVITVIIGTCPRKQNYGIVSNQEFFHSYFVSSQDR